MPTRTELVISFGDIVECLPPGKSYRRKRYNSFDANIGNEENLDPSSLSESCDNMKPDSRKVNTGKCDDTDDEISFRDVSTNGEEAEELEVLNSKTRSHRQTKSPDSDDEASSKFQSSFFDFLKSKGVSKESGRSRHKSAESEAERDKSSGSRTGRSKSSFSRYGRSRSSGRNLNGRERSLSRSRRRKRSLTDLDGSEVFASESDSECSVRLPRLDVVKSRVRSASPSECSDISVKSGRNTRSKSSARDLSPSGSDVDITARVRNRRSKSRTRASRSSVRESTPIELSKHRRRSRRDLSPTGSDAESLASNASKSGKNRQDSDDEEDEKGSKRGRRCHGRRSELDKLLEAVDTSFHFETAAAERKRLSESGNSGSGLGPLEIDCSDTGSETSFKTASKRKMVNTDKSPSRKKFKASNNLLKTASPGVHIKSEDDTEHSDDCVWEGWDKLNDDLDNVTDSPVEINKLHFSFETVPLKESWFLTYQRQDRGDEIVFYPTSTSNPFLLPYQMPYSAFLLNKPLKKENDASNEHSKASSPVRQLGEPGRKGERKKISDCESTDSSEELRRGRAGRPSKMEKLGRAAAHLMESNYRVSPRCHASTKSLGITGNAQGDIEDLEDFHIMQDEKELNYSSLPSFLPREETSNDSFCSSSAASRGTVRTESLSELISLSKSLDSMLQDPEELAKPNPEASKAAKLPPTRSRVSSDQLLSPKKTKKKKKGSVDGPGYEPLDQLVADNVDPVLLDCLEDELPTVPGPLLEPVLSSPLELLETYSLCRSMKECNSRWLRPNNHQSISSARKEAKKKIFDPNKPRKIIIYKDDLPGFSLDADLEDEKLPVSKRGSSKKEVKSKPATVSSKSKQITDPSKPKRVIIYKDDLPGFSLDADLEDEKLPVSKRDGAKKSKSKEKKKSPVKDANNSDEDVDSDEVEVSKKLKSKEKRKSPIKDLLKSDEEPESDGPVESGKKSLDKKKSSDATNSDEDVESVESFSSTSSVTKKRRKTNKTGFPTPKKKKKIADTNSSVKEASKKLSEKSSSKSEKSSKASPKKLTAPKQKKIDEYLSKKSSKTNAVASAASKRSVAMKAKNYSEVESDTDSLLETSLLTPDKKLKPSSVQKSVKKR